MKVRALSLLVCLLLLPGCYVLTQVEAQGGTVPPDFSSRTLVVAVRDRVGLTESQVVGVEQDAVQALTARGIESVSLNEATGARPGDARDLLKRRDYRALLEIVVTSWGSKLETLSTSAVPSVGTLETDPDTSFFKPGSIERSEYSGPTASYKEVRLKASLLDLQGDRVIWSAEFTARPAVVGRSFLYHRFNQNLRYEDLARDCLGKLARELPRIQRGKADSSG
jgi:hypothetical protein